MSLFEQKYPNNIRTISGLVNVPFQDDVVLMCNTSAGAVAIQLADIPANKWNTLWKLYVVDLSGNALVNNITITAPLGYLINGAGSFTINSNNASLLIRVGSNTNYVGQYSVISGGGGGGYSTIQDEGVAVTQRAIMNFIGATVTAVDDAINNRTNITIAGGGGATPFLFARKNLNDPLAVYVPHTINTGVRSVASAGATVLNAFDTKQESGIAGFDLATGIWTVDADGWYSLSAKMITRINPTDVDSNVDGGGLSWVSSFLFDDGQGFIGIALIQDGANIICSNKQFVTNKIGDVNIDCSVEAVQLGVGQRVKFHTINWTSHDVIGHAYGLAGVPECQVQIAIKKVA